MQKTRALLKKIHKSPPQKWFAAVALVFGAAFVFATPPYQVPDEFGHASKAYLLSEGRIFPEKTEESSGGFIPSSLGVIGVMADGKGAFSPLVAPGLFEVPLNPGDKAFAQFPNLVVYSPLVYAPQAAGMAIGRAVQLPAAGVFYAGRLANLIAYVTLFYLAIRLIPFGKWAMAIVALLPMHLLLAGSLSADPATIAIVGLFIAAVLYMRTLLSPLTRRQIIYVALASVAIGLTKIPFPLILVMLLLIPVRVLGGTRKRWLAYILGIAGLAALTAMLWLLLVKNYAIPYGPPGVDPSSQLSFILSHPLAFIKIIFLNYVSSASDIYVQQYVVSVGPVAMWLPVWLTYAYTLFLGFVFFGLSSKSKAVLSRWQKLLIGGLAAAIVTVIGALLYISWTPVASPKVEGFQARYFTPLLLLLIPLCCAKVARVRHTFTGEMLYRYVPPVFLAASLWAAIYFFTFEKIASPF